MEHEYRGLHALALEHRRLTKAARTQLAAAHVEECPGRPAAAAFRDRLPYPIADVAVIEKCNAFIVVASVSTPTDPDYVRLTLLRRWLELAPGLGPHVAKVKSFHEESCLQYLAEVAIGLRSVVLGDSQVYAQVVDGLGTAEGSNQPGSSFGVVARELRGLLQDTRNSTTLQQGNTSLERLACERIRAELGPGDGTISVIGLGRTGRLMTEILTKESRHDLRVTNRSVGRTVPQHPRVEPVPWGSLGRLSDVDVAVLAVTCHDETKQLAERLLAAADSGARATLVVDMTSPSVTAGLTLGPTVRLVRLHDLAKTAEANLTSRQQSVNKARSIASRWAAETKQHLGAGQRPARAKTERGPAGLPSPTRVVARGTALGAVRERLQKGGFVEVPSPVLPPRPTPDAGEEDAVAEAARWRDLYRQGVVRRGVARAYEIVSEAPRSSAAVSGARLELELADVGKISELHEIAAGIVLSVAESLTVGGLAAGGLSLPGPGSVPVLDYREAHGLLADAGLVPSFGAAVDPLLGLLLGRVMRQRTGFDLFVLRDHPGMDGPPDTAFDDEGAAERFDIFVDGFRLGDGQIREAMPDRLAAQLAVAAVGPRWLKAYLAHVDPEHAHGGIHLDLDQLVARLLGCGSIRELLLPASSDHAGPLSAP